MPNIYNYWTPQRICLWSMRNYILIFMRVISDYTIVAILLKTLHFPRIDNWDLAKVHHRGSMFLWLVIGAWQGARQGGCVPASGEYLAGRDIGLRYQHACIEKADECDYAAARPGEHECTCTAALRAHRTRTAFAPARLLLYNNYRLIKICYLTLR